MKKLVTVLLTMAMVIAMMGCGKKSDIELLQGNVWHITEISSTAPKMFPTTAYAYMSADSFNVEFLSDGSVLIDAKDSNLQDYESTGYYSYSLVDGRLKIAAPLGTTCIVGYEISKDTFKVIDGENYAIFSAYDGNDDSSAKSDETESDGEETGIAEVSETESDEIAASPAELAIEPVKILPAEPVEIVEADSTESEISKDDAVLSLYDEVLKNIISGKELMSSEGEAYEYSYATAPGYALYDIDKDGTDELFVTTDMVGEYHSSYSIYYLNEGTLDNRCFTGYIPDEDIWIYGFDFLTRAYTFNGKEGFKEFWELVYPFEDDDPVVLTYAGQEGENITIEEAYELEAKKIIEPKGIIWHALDKNTNIFEG